MVGWSYVLNNTLIKVKIIAALQVATQDHVFLFDLLEFLNPADNGSTPNTANEASGQCSVEGNQQVPALSSAMQIETPDNSQLMRLVDECLCFVLQNQVREPRDICD
jgi:hypothetical protein